MKKVKIILFSLLSTAMSAQCLQSAYYFSGDGQDALGNANTATVSGATLTNDRFGNPNSAYEFDGINDYIDTKTTFDYDFKSISFWAYPHTIAGSNAVVCQDADASKLNYGTTVSNFRNDSILKAHPGGGVNSKSVLTNATANQWYHVVLVRQGPSDPLLCYVNGVPIPMNPYHQSGQTGSSSYPYEFLVIGANRKRNAANFDGVIDDVLIYNCALDSATIDSLYNFNPNDTISGDSCLVAYYPFSNGNGNDVLGNANTSIVKDAVATSDVKGNSNRAMYFNGTNSYISTQTSFDYATRTVSFWMQPKDLASTGVVMCQNSSALNYGTINVSVENGNSITGSIASNTSLITNTADTNTWYHVAMVRDGANSYFYLNGSLVNSASSGTAGSSVNPNDNLVFGVKRNLGADFYKGSLDEVRIYDCALDSTKILELSDTSSFFKRGPLQVKPVNQADISIYPNPASSSLNLKWNNLNETCKFELLSLNGQLIKSEELNGQDSQLKINTSSYKRGLYLFRITTLGGDLISNGKIVLH